MAIPVKVTKVWNSGDYIYGAVKGANGLYPAGCHFLFVDGNEYPVARLHVEHVSGVDSERVYTVARWIKRDEAFPEPIKGFNV